MAEKNVADLQSAQASHERGATNKVYHKQKFKGPPQNETNPQYQRLCGRCGSQPHTNGPCPALKFNCHKCGMKGHFAKVCRKKTSRPQNTSGQGNRTQFVDAETAEPETEEPISQKPETEYFMYKTTSNKEAPCMILELDIAENKTRMEIDTGASLTIISEATYSSWKNPPELSHSEIELKTYTGDKIPVVGSCEVAVKHHSQNMKLPLLIVAGNGPNLLGRNWLSHLKLNNYKLVYKPGAKKGNADALSRLPLKDSVNHTPKPADYVFVMNHMESTPVTPDYIREWTSRDPVLSQVREFVLKGWPSQSSPDIAPYWKRRDELSVHDGCIMWGARVIIPPQGRNRLTEELHDTHPGICRMKSLARSYFWWPNMDEQLENKVKHCAECQESRKTPPVAPLHPWEWPKKPWSRVHLDYAGPFLGRMFLVLVDAHSKWMDIFPVHRATSTMTIEKLRETFAIHGLPEVIVTDNGTCFTSAEFQQFLAANSIRHVRTAPFHPSSNGLAERAVQSFKAAMKRMKDGSVETKLSRFLMRYRITPHATTGVPPAQLLFNRLPRSRFDGVRPSVESRVHTKQLDQKRRHDQHAKERKFNVGDPVYVKNFAGGPKWLPGTVVKSRGQLHYEVRLSDDRLCNRHIDHVRRREDTFPIPVGEENEEHENVEPLVVRRSNREKRQPERYGEPIPY